MLAEPDLLKYLPYPPIFESSGVFENWWETAIQQNRMSCWFAIVLNTSELAPKGTVAGVIGLLRSIPEDLHVELGYVRFDRMPTPFCALTSHSGDLLQTISAHICGLTCKWCAIEALA